MRIFISWSGERSRQIAELLRSWIPGVIQEVQPFVSSQDIAKGTRGMETIGRQLAETDFGIVVLTPENASAPWINFEAGALSKSLAHGHVVPLLCDVAEIEIPNSPLRQFQWARFEKDEIHRVMADVNDSCTLPLDGARLAKAFELWWPHLEADYAALPKAPKPERSKPASQNARFEEVLETIVSDLTALRRESSNHTAMISKLRNRPAVGNIIGPLGTAKFAGNAGVTWSELRDLEDRAQAKGLRTQDLADALRSYRKSEDDDQGPSEKS